ncbi:MAG: hypothetical protein ACO3VR_01695 [Lutimaribacter sp.]
MAAERIGMPTKARVLNAALAGCLGCADCGGACWHALQLRMLPEAVLHAKGQTQ